MSTNHAHDKATHQKHMAEMGEKNVAIVVQEGIHRTCQKECDMDNLFFDFTDEQIDGAVKLLSRSVHFTPGNNFQLFQHLVREQEDRQTLKADILGVNSNGR